MERKMLFIIGICFLLTTSFFSGCVDDPQEITPLSIVSFTIEPNTIAQGEYANLSWEVTGAISANIDKGIGNVTLKGNRIVQPTQTTTYILTALNETTTKSTTAAITVIYPFDQIAPGDCADVHYIGRYSSNNTIFDTSYAIAQSKTGGTPLKIFVSFDKNATSPKAGYSSEIIEGFMEGIIGMKEGETKVIGPIPPEKAYGLNKLTVGSVFTTQFLAFGMNQTVEVIKYDNENLSLKWIEM